MVTEYFPCKLWPLLPRASPVMLNYRYNETYAVINTEGTDGYEQYYLEKGTSNRMYLSLRSQIPSETDWALSRLLHLSSDCAHEFSIKDVDGLVDALLEFPLNASKQLLQPDYDAYAHRNSLHQASDAVTIILNLCTIDNNLPLIHAYHRIILGLCQRYLRIFEKTDVANEITLKVLNIMESISHLLTDIPKNPLLSMIANLVYSKDRAYMLLSLRMMGTFAKKNKSTKRFEELAANIYQHVAQIALVPDAHLRAAALELIYATASTIPNILKALMTTPQMPIFIKSLAYMLYDETTEEIRVDEFIETGKPRPLRSRPQVLSGEDTERIGKMTEDARTKEWIKVVFEEKPGYSYDQSRVFPLYNETLSKYSYHTPLQNAETLLRLFGKVLPTAKTVLHKDGTYQITNVKLRCLLPTYSCGWGDDRSEHDSASELYAYIVRTYIDVPEPPTTFVWFGEVVSIDATSSISRQAQLKAKLLTLFPVDEEERKRQSDMLVTQQKDARALDEYNPSRRPVINAFEHEGVAFSVLHVPSDNEGHPRGIAYQAALLIRLMAQKANPYAKNVLQADEANRPESKGYYGLPIPPSYEEEQPTADEEQAETYPQVTNLLSLFARSPLADVGLRSSSQLSEVCLEAFEFVQNENFGSLIVEAV